MTPEERKARGITAQAILNDETIKQGWSELEDELRHQWEACLLPRKRDRIWTQLKHLRDLRAKLASYAARAPRD